MKRIICALLTVVMLAAMIPSFAMTAAAADPVCPDAPAGYIPVSVVSYTPADQTILNKAFDVTNEDRIYVSNVEIIGKFANPTKVTNVIFNPQYYTQRLNGTVVYLSVDGVEWTEVLSITNHDGQGWYKYDQATFKLYTADIEYNYVKIVQPNTHDCKWVAFYNNGYDGRLNVTTDMEASTKNACTLDGTACGHGDHTVNPNASWDKIWDINNTTRIGYQFSEAVEIVGAFDAPTAVTKIAFNSVYYHTRLNNVKVYLSADNGATWTAQLGITNMTYTASSYKVIEFAIDAGFTKWTHIKITQDTQASGYYQFDLRWIAVYNEPNAKFQKVYPVSTASVASAAAKLWNYEGVGNGLYIDYSKQTSSGQNTVVTTAEFATPTVIDQIYLKPQSVSYASRANHMILQGSVDGQNWVQLNRTNGAPATEEIVLTVQDSTAYKFIRLIKGNNYGSFGLGSIGILGTPTAPEANTTEADFYGVQTKVDADAWALRLISTVDSLDFKAVGYEIKVTGLDKDGAAVEKFFDEYTQTVYSSVVDNMGTRNAKALGGNYIFTATINGISIEKYAALTFEIKPYVADAKGQKTYGETQTYTFEDGVQK